MKYIIKYGSKIFYFSFLILFTFFFYFCSYQNKSKSESKKINDTELFTLLKQTIFCLDRADMRKLQNYVDPEFGLYIGSHIIVPYDKVKMLSNSNKTYYWGTDAADRRINLSFKKRISEVFKLYNEESKKVEENITFAHPDPNATFYYMQSHPFGSKINLNKTWVCQVTFFSDVREEWYFYFHLNKGKTYVSGFEYEPWSP